MQYKTIADGLAPLSKLSHPKEVIRQFTPNWFAMTMGTGILALALSAQPFQFQGLFSFGELLWKFNIVLFCLFSLLYTARWIFFFDGARRIFGHSVVSMFFGCIPMGLATIINGLLVYGPASLGEASRGIALDLWCLDAVLALGCGVIIPFMMFTNQQHSIEKMTAVWLLPVVASEVAAVSAGFIAPGIVDSGTQLWVLISGYVLWACSVPVAMGILVILLLRMALHKLPEASMAASSWLALGPIGTGALGLLLLGEATPKIFNAHHLGGLGAGVEGCCLVAALLLWGYGMWWLMMAILITFRHFQNHVPFNLGWWGYTFPLGVYALATLRLQRVLSLEAFGMFGALLTGALAILWVIVASRTVAGAWRGELFVSPCLLDAEIVPNPMSESKGAADRNDPPCP